MVKIKSHGALNRKIKSHGALNHKSHGAYIVYVNIYKTTKRKEIQKHMGAQR